MYTIEKFKRNNLQTIPLELISNLISIFILFMIFKQYLSYKKTITVLNKLNEEKQSLSLSFDDKEYVKSNLEEYDKKLIYQTSLNKLLYPIFIIIAAGMTLVFDFSQALIHFNIIIVSFIYVAIIKIHLNNIVKSLKGLNT